MRIVFFGTALCWLGSLLMMTPYMGFFFVPMALVGSMMVLFSPLAPRPKIIRGLLPLLPHIAYFI